MYHISTISDTLRQGVDSLAQWLEHWISTPAIRVRIPSGTWDFFSSYASFLSYEFSYSQDGGSSEMDHLSHLVIVMTLL